VYCDPVSEGETDWRPIGQAPMTGVVIEARGPDWGRGPRVTAYRARRLGDTWVNAEDPREQLDYLTEWRDAAPRGETFDQLFDDLPIAELPEHEVRGIVVNLLCSIVDGRRAGDHSAADAILQLSRAFPTPGYSFDKPKWNRCPKCGGRVVKFFAPDVLGGLQQCVGAGEDQDDGCGWDDEDILPDVKRTAAAVSNPKERLC